MAGPKFAGANSSLTFPNLTVGVHTYTTSPAMDKLETTTFDDAADGILAETSIAGMFRGGVIPVSIRYDSTNTVWVGDVGSLVLTLESGKTITCSAWVQSITITSDVAGLIEASASLQVTGPMTPPA